MMTVVSGLDLMNSFCVTRRLLMEKACFLLKLCSQKHWNTKGSLCFVFGGFLGGCGGLESLRERITNEPAMTMRTMKRRAKLFDLSPFPTFAIVTAERERGKKKKHAGKHSHAGKKKEKSVKDSKELNIGHKEHPTGNHMVQPRQQQQVYEEEESSEVVVAVLRCSVEQASTVFQTLRVRRCVWRNWSCNGDGQQEQKRRSVVMCVRQQ